MLTGASFASYQNFERLPLLICWSYEIKRHGVEVTFSRIIFLLNFFKIYQFVQNVLVEDTDSMVIF
jgi:hypothetical protein